MFKINASSRRFFFVLSLPIILTLTFPAPLVAYPNANLRTPATGAVKDGGFFKKILDDFHAVRGDGRPQFAAEGGTKKELAELVGGRFVRANLSGPARLYGVETSRVMDIDVLKTGQELPEEIVGIRADGSVIEKARATLGPDRRTYQLQVNFNDLENPFHTTLYADESLIPKLQRAKDGGTKWGLQELLSRSLKALGRDAERAARKGYIQLEIEGNSLVVIDTVGGGEILRQMLSKDLFELPPFSDKLQTSLLGMVGGDGRTFNIHDLDESPDKIIFSKTFDKPISSPRLTEDGRFMMVRVGDELKILQFVKAETAKDGDVKEAAAKLLRRNSPFRMGLNGFEVVADDWADGVEVSDLSVMQATLDPKLGSHFKTIELAVRDKFEDNVPQNIQEDLSSLKRSIEEITPLTTESIQSSDDAVVESIDNALKDVTERANKLFLTVWENAGRPEIRSAKDGGLAKAVEWVASLQPGQIKSLLETGRESAWQEAETDMSKRKAIIPSIIIISEEAVAADATLVKRLQNLPENVLLVLLSRSGKWQEMLRRIETFSKRAQTLSSDTFAAVITPTTNGITDINDVENVIRVAKKRVLEETDKRAEVAAYVVEEGLLSMYQSVLKDAYGIVYKLPEEDSGQVTLGAKVFNNLLDFLSLSDEEKSKMLDDLKEIVIPVTPSLPVGELGQYFLAYDAVVRGV